MPMRNPMDPHSRHHLAVAMIFVSGLTFFTVASTGCKSKGQPENLDAQSAAPNPSAAAVESKAPTPEPSDRKDPNSPECEKGTAGCPCNANLPGGCKKSLDCLGNYCWGGDVKVPDSYMYKPEAIDDHNLNRETIRKHLALEPGDRVIDVGAGHGHFTFVTGKMVGPSGIVYATDIDTKSNEAIGKKERQERAKNPSLATIEPLLCKEPRDTATSQLQPESVRVVLMILSAVFARSDDTPNPTETINADLTYLREFLRVMKANGRFYYHLDWVRPGMLPLDELAALFAEAGFDKKYELLPMPDRAPETTFLLTPSGDRMDLKRGFIAVFRKPEK